MWCLYTRVAWRLKPNFCFICPKIFLAFHLFLILRSEALSSGTNPRDSIRNELPSYPSRLPSSTLHSARSPLLFALPSFSSCGSASGAVCTLEPMIRSGWEKRDHTADFFGLRDTGKEPYSRQDVQRRGRRASLHQEKKSVSIPSFSVPFASLSPSSLSPSPLRSLGERSNSETLWRHTRPGAPGSEADLSEKLTMRSEQEEACNPQRRSGHDVYVYTYTYGMYLGRHVGA